MTKKDKYRIFNESRDTYIECICESEPFRNHMTLIHTRNLICVTIKNNSLTYSYKSMNRTIITHIRVDHIYIFCTHSHSHSFKCYSQLKIEKI